MLVKTTIALTPAQYGFAAHGGKLVEVSDDVGRKMIAAMHAVPAIKVHVLRPFRCYQPGDRTALSDPEYTMRVCGGYVAAVTPIARDVPRAHERKPKRRRGR